MSSGLRFTVKVEGLGLRVLGFQGLAVTCLRRILVWLLCLEVLNTFISRQVEV